MLLRIMISVPALKKKYSTKIKLLLTHPILILTVLITLLNPQLARI